MVTHEPASSVESRAPSSAPGEDRVAELAVLAADGDEAAFGDLWRLMAPALHGILMSMVPAQDAGDLLQEVCLKVMRALPRLEDPRRAAPWMAAIARNRGRDALRSSGRRHATLPDDVPGVPPREHELAARVMAVIRSMPEAYREPLSLRLAEGLTGPEIAERVGMTPGSLRVNLCRGMKLLREKLGREGLM